MSDRTAAVAQCVPAGGSYADCGHRTTARVVKRPQPGTHWGPQAGFRPTNAVPWQHQPLTYVTFGVMSDFTTIGSHVAHLASKQAGVVSGQQVLERGMSRRQIDRQLASQTCLTLLSGIYVLGGVPITWTTWAWAGVLATGPGACLVGASAAAARSWADESWPITIAIHPSRRLRLRTDRVRALRLDVPRHEVVYASGLPITNRLRTAVDVAHLLPLAEAQQLWTDGWYLTASISRRSPTLLQSRQLPGAGVRPSSEDRYRIRGRNGRDRDQWMGLPLRT